MTTVQPPKQTSFLEGVYVAAKESWRPCMDAGDSIACISFGGRWLNAKGRLAKAECYIAWFRSLVATRLELLRRSRRKR